MSRTIRFATRGSPLARLQVALVTEHLRAVGVRDEVALVVVKTSPDRFGERPISSFSGVGAFTVEVDQAVIDGRADIAVHSAKDLPARQVADKLVLGAMLERTEVRDALVGKTLEQLHPGDLVRTGSVRRRAQLGWLRLGLFFEELRGNIATRLTKVPDGGAIVVAYVALERLGISEVATEVLSPTVMVPQVGQGAIALSCRKDDDFSRQILSGIDDTSTHIAVRAERAFLGALGEGCEAPIAAYATYDEALAEVAIEGLIATVDGTALLRRSLRGSDPEATGVELATLLLDTDGGRQLLQG